MNYKTKNRILRDTGEIKTPVSQCYKICPSCSFFCNILEEDQYCSSCGTKLITACTDCGREIVNPYANYCKFCGTPLSKRKVDEEEF